MKIYVASRWDNKDTDALKKMVASLHRPGTEFNIEVCSRWLEFGQRPETDVPHFQDYLRGCAAVDKADLDACDALLLWHVDMEGTRGGCHWEAGYMYGQGKPVVLYTDVQIISPFYVFDDVTIIHAPRGDDVFRHFVELAKA